MYTCNIFPVTTPLCVCSTGCIMLMYISMAILCTCKYGSRHAYYIHVICIGLQRHCLLNTTETSSRTPMTPWFEIMNINLEFKIWNNENKINIWKEIGNTARFKQASRADVLNCICLSHLLCYSKELAMFV